MSIRLCSCDVILISGQLQYQLLKIEEERKSIRDYYRQIMAKEGRRPGIRELNTVLGTNHSFFADVYGKIGDLERDLGLPERGSSRTIAATLARKKQREQRKQTTVSPEAPTVAHHEAGTQGDRLSQYQLNLLRQLLCPWCSRRLGWDGAMNLHCRIEHTYIMCGEHNVRFGFDPNTNIASDGYGHSFLADLRHGSPNRFTLWDARDPDLQ